MAGLGVTGTELVLEQHQHEYNKLKLSDEKKDNLNNIIITLYANVLKWKEYAGTDEERYQLEQNLSILWQNLTPQMKKGASKETFTKQITANIISPWFRYFLAVNPLEYIEKLTIPILAINGENDTQVNYQTNLTGIENALQRANNKQYIIKSYPNLNHLFQDSTTGEIDEYGKNEQTFSPIVLSDISDWIKQQVE